MSKSRNWSMLAASLAVTPVWAESIRITPEASRPSTIMSAPNFTGSAVVQQLNGAEAPSRSTGGVAGFAPGTRSAWHTHPAGQVLIVLSGTGWIQEWGGPKREFKAGDVVYIPPGVKHWHGATATNGMRHVAIQDAVEGQSVEGMEPSPTSNTGREHGGPDRGGTPPMSPAQHRMRRRPADRDRTAQPSLLRRQLQPRKTRHAR